MFPNREGEPWTTKHDWANWRARTWQPAAAAAGIGELVDERRYVTVDGQRRRRTHRKYMGASPYDLRHSFASLLLAEGRSVHYVARQLGHAPSMTLDTYGHVVDEFDEAPRVDAEEEIRRAREASVPVSYLSTG